MNYADVVEVYPGIQSTLGFWFSQVHCSGLEENLLDCERRFGHEINCQGTRNEVGVRCFSEKGEKIIISGLLYIYISCAMHESLLFQVSIHSIDLIPLSYFHSCISLFQ